MDRYIRECCKRWGCSFDKIIQQYNLNEKTKYWLINFIIDYKIEHNRDVIYKEDIPKICSKWCEKDMSQEEFMEKVMECIEYYKLDINNLTPKNCCNYDLWIYYLWTLLENEPVDIKIALKD